MNVSNLLTPLLFAILAIAATPVAACEPVNLIALQPENLNSHPSFKPPPSPPPRPPRRPDDGGRTRD